MLDIQSLVANKFQKIQTLPFFIQKPIYEILKIILYEKKTNILLNKYSNLTSFDFIDHMLDEFNFSYKVMLSQIENIPAAGRVIIIANHPLGILDALCLIHMIKRAREDVKIVANDILMQIKPLEPLFLAVDTFGSKISKNSIDKIYSSLDNEEAVIIFPSGEVSRLSTTGIQDTKWQKGFLKFALNKNAPILPIYIKAKNSLFFYIASMLNKRLSAFLLPHEMFNKKNKSIEFIIGKLIPCSSFKNINISTQEKILLFKQHLYNISKGKPGIFATVKGISLPENRQNLKKELKDAKILGSTNDSKIIYLFEYISNSSLLREIGRLRELSFREVGEGTGRKRDIDDYDKYYKHIVLWDEEHLEVVGSYRLAQSDIVYNKFGISGFYSNTLFTFQPDFKRYLNDSIELGRSFIQPKYWRGRALDYLWQGIGAYLRNNPNVKYLFGPVSLSAHLCKNAQNLIIFYYDKYYGGKKELLKPIKPLVLTKAETKQMQEIFIGKNKKENFLILKKNLKFYKASVPTLYKQYADLCDDGGITFMGYNIDKEFNNCVDSFILVNVENIKEKKYARYIGTAKV